MGVKEVFCADCRVPFNVETALRSGRTPTRCDGCKRKFNRERQYRWRAANPERWKVVTDRQNAKRLADPEHLREKREREAMRLYGLAPSDLELLAANQGGVCAICVGPPRRIGRSRGVGRLHIDHDHATGRIRGLLCGNCNTMIGLAGENPDVLIRAAAYLLKEAT